MLKRKVYSKLLQWKNKEKKKALLITGARQIGKTYIIRKFAKENYDKFVEINFINTPSAKEIFKGDLDAESIIAAITAFTLQPLEIGNTLIFFDEIQECPEARTAIKFLVDDGRFDYISSGSLLGVHYKEVPSYPVGYEEILKMYPLDIEEFLIANELQEETFKYLKNCYDDLSPIKPAIHEILLKLFNLYVIVGGMPAAVQEYIESKDIAKVLDIQKDIVELYRQDITKYSTADKIKIKDIFDTIPSELNKNNKRFFLSDLNKNARRNRYESSFAWLSDAGVSLPCTNVTEPTIPLKINEQRNLQKLFLCDTGLLCAMSFGNVQFDIIKGDLSVNMGSILENTMAENLLSNGFRLNYLDKKSFGEIDFIVQQGKEIIPIEIKSGKDYKNHTSLTKTINNTPWGIKKGIVFSIGNIEKGENIIYLPLYMLMFFRQEVIDKPLIIHIDTSNI